MPRPPGSRKVAADLIERAATAKPGDAGLVLFRPGRGDPVIMIGPADAIAGSMEAVAASLRAPVASDTDPDPTDSPPGEDPA